MKRSWWFLLAFGSLVSAASCGTSGDLSLGSFPSTQVVLTGGTSSLGGSDPVGSAGYGGYQTGFGGDFPSCLPGAGLPSAAHRYDFSGSGPDLLDRNGSADGEVFGGAVLDDSGQLSLDGEDDYVDLANGIFGTGPSISILLWARIESGPAYWRIFDFGTSSDGEDPPEDQHTVGTYYIALTPETGFEPNGLALFIGRGGPSSETKLLSPIQIAEQEVAIAVVLDGEADRASLFFGGRVVSETALGGPLSDFEEVNNWLGKSQYSADPHARGTYDELRIYHQALTACEVSALTALGPDDPGTD
jgi:hypothetical protein